jgi:hypothetical protein
MDKLFTSGHTGYSQVLGTPKATLFTVAGIAGIATSNPANQAGSGVKSCIMFFAYKLMHLFLP